MIQLELRTTHRNSEGRLDWIPVACIRAYDDVFELSDPSGFFDLGRLMSSPRHEKPFAFADDPEEWVRSLALIFNAPDLAVAVQQDTNPWPTPRDVDAFVPDFANAPVSPVAEVPQAVAMHAQLSN